MEDAVDAAYKLAQKGDAVLPACAILTFSIVMKIVGVSLRNKSDCFNH